MRIFGAERVSNLMDKIGYKEGDVIEHSWMTKTIERNQKRMEQNNFGIRKRLLEYDDVMNKQRSNIYRMRKNALWGDKLSIDLRNMLFNWCNDTVINCKDQGSYEELELEVIRTLAAGLPFDEATFDSTKTDDLVDMLFADLSSKYRNKLEKIAEQAYPVFQHIRSEQGERIENVVVPMTDGTHQFQLTVSMQKALDTQCRSLSNDFEKSTTLQTIDDEWKEHLRELDELKQSTGNAQYEQKDPLLIYKIESFELFGKMLQRINHKVLGLLFRTRISDDNQVGEARKPMRKDTPKVVASKEEFSNGSDSQEAIENSAPKVPQNPIRNELKVGRNDACPCGSGKKFKSCHGKD
jgi:preprotein translocase subunit SecA